MIEPASKGPEWSTDFERDPKMSEAMAQAIVGEMVRRLKERGDLLSELLEYFDDRADADYSDEVQRAIGNEEMRLAMRIRAALGKEQV